MEQRQGEQVPAAGVEQGEEDQGLVVIPQAPGADLAEGIEDLSLVGDQSALGQARGAAGVDDEVGVLQLQCGAGHGGIVAARQQLVIHGVAQGIVFGVQADKLLQRAHLRQSADVSGVDALIDQHLGLLVGHELSQLLRGETGVVRHQDGSQLARGKVAVDKLHAAAAEEGHPVALFNAIARAQQVGQNIGPAVQVAVGILLLCIHVHHGHAVCAQPGAKIGIVADPTVIHGTSLPFNARRLPPGQISVRLRPSFAGAGPDAPGRLRRTLRDPGPPCWRRSGWAW